MLFLLIGVRTHRSPTGHQRRRRHSALLPRLVPEVQLNFSACGAQEEEKEAAQMSLRQHLDLQVCVCKHSSVCVCVCVMRG